MVRIKKKKGFISSTGSKFIKISALFPSSHNHKEPGSTQAPSLRETNRPEWQLWAWGWHHATGRSASSQVTARRGKSWPVMAVFSSKLGSGHPLGVGTADWQKGHRKWRPFSIDSQHTDEDMVKTSHNHISNHQMPPWHSGTHDWITVTANLFVKGFSAS